MVGSSASGDEEISLSLCDPTPVMVGSGHSGSGGEEVSLSLCDPTPVGSGHGGGEEVSQLCEDDVTEASGEGSSGPSLPQSVTDDSSGFFYHDLGDVCKLSMSLEEISLKIHSLTPAQKYTLLKEHYTQVVLFHSPKFYNNGCNGSFKYGWFKENPWLVYSKSLNGGFCIYCALFAKDRKKTWYACK